MTGSSAHNVITFAELERLGHSKGAIQWAVADGRLFPKYDGVYAIGREDLTEEGEWLAAVWACSEEGALGRRSAAVMRRLLDFGDGEHHVVVPFRCSGRGPKGVRVHRSRDLTESDIEIVDHIPVTTVPRTLLDLARSERNDAPIEGAMLRARKLYGVDLAEVATTNARLRRILKKHDPLLALTQSELEKLFLKLCRKYGLALPLCQEPFWPYHADFTWHEYKLIVETDGGEHRTPERQRADNIRDRALKAMGYETLRFTRAELVHEPAKVARELRAAFARRARELGYSGGA